MWPTNKKTKGCSPTSSDCVIWQGPDIECLNLCKGDTVSDVVAKLATELCNVLEILNIESYELTCFNITDCPPETFQELLQFLIERICALEGIDSESGGSGSGCPDCLVNIATCFYYTDELGNTQTTMQLQDYVTAIGNRVCGLATSIDTLNTTVANHENRIQALENGELPVQKSRGAEDEVQVTPNCLLTPGTPVPVSTLLAELEKEFCELIGATGKSGDIYTSILTQCTGLATDTQLAGSGTMGSIPGWFDEPKNLAEAFSNVWNTMCDVRSAIKNIQANCCPSACDDVDVTLTAALNAPTDLRLFFTGTVPPNFTECNPTGTLVTIEDTTGGKHTIQVPVLSNINNATGYQVDLTTSPVNPADDLTITAALCFRDPETGTECQSVATYVYINTSTCPSMIISPDEEQIDYQFNWTGAAATITVELLDSSGTVLIQSNVHVLAGPATVLGSFTGLTPSTGYRIRAKVTIGTTTTTCPFVAVSTLDPVCLPPSGVSASIN